MGARFDPKVHEAIGSAESAEFPDDTVIDELRPGYRLHDRVLRPALVRVSRQPAPTG
jgi:molecular chaperone GrpE